MNVIMRPRQTLDEFLVWERQQELAYEFDGVAARAMNGGTVSHSLIAANLLLLLRSVLDHSRFRIVPSGVKVIVGGHVRNPDLIVAAQFDDTTVDVVPDPVAVVEVVSPSSTTIDQHSLILEQNTVAATMWTRNGVEWVGRLVSGDAPLPFPALDVTIRLADI